MISVSLSFTDPKLRLDQLGDAGPGNTEGHNPANTSGVIPPPFAATFKVMSWHKFDAANWGAHKRQGGGEESKGER